MYAARPEAWHACFFFFHVGLIATAQCIVQAMACGPERKRLCALPQRQRATARNSASVNAMHRAHRIEVRSFGYYTAAQDKPQLGYEAMKLSTCFQEAFAGRHCLIFY